MQEAMFPDIDFSNFSSFIFKVHRIFIEKEDYPSEKVVIDEEELDGIDKDGQWRVGVRWVRSHGPREKVCPF